MISFFAIIWNGFREARRNKVTVVVAAFALVALLCTSLITAVTVSTFDRVVTDFGLGTMSLILVFLAIFLSSGLLSREIERRTIFLIVSKPVSRSQFLIARLLGNMLTLGVMLLAMTAIFCLELWLLKLPITSTKLAAAGTLWFELLVLSSAGFLFSSFASQTVSALATSGLFFAGHLSGDIYALAHRSPSAGMKLLGEAVYYLLPNLERVNFRPLATYGLPVPPSAALSGIAYSVLYSVVLCVLATLIFERRDFR